MDRRFSRRVNQLYHKSFRFATFLLEFSRWIDVFRSTAAFRPSLVPYKSGLSGCSPAAAARPLEAQRRIIESKSLLKSKLLLSHPRDRMVKMATTLQKRLSLFRFCAGVCRNRNGLPP